jgi:hypothetical protein
MVRQPNQNRGVALVRLEDPDGGSEGYKFDLEWRGTDGNFSSGSAGNGGFGGGGFGNGNNNNGDNGNGGSIFGNNGNNGTIITFPAGITDNSTSRGGAMATTVLSADRTSSCRIAP